MSGVGRYPLAFLDMETTGLQPDADVWEYALIRRDPGSLDVEHHAYVQHDPAKCRALPEPFLSDHHARYPRVSCGELAGLHPRDAVDALEHLTRGAVIVGAVPSFDVEHLTRMVQTRVPGARGRWHYQLVDVEAIATGHLWALLRVHGVTPGILAALGVLPGEEFSSAMIEALLDPPWDSDLLSRACGVEPPGEGVRHTALGDVRWARDLYDACTRGPQPCRR